MSLDLRAEFEGVHTLPPAERASERPFGVLASEPLILPEARATCHYAAFQRHDPGNAVPTDQAIGGANRVQGLQIHHWGELVEGGLRSFAHRVIQA